MTHDDILSAELSIKPSLWGLALLYCVRVSLPLLIFAIMSLLFNRSLGQLDMTLFIALAFLTLSAIIFPLIGRQYYVLSLAGDKLTGPRHNGYRQVTTHLDSINKRKTTSISWQQKLFDYRLNHVDSFDDQKIIVHLWMYPRNLLDKLFEQLSIKEALSKQRNASSLLL